MQTTPKASYVNESLNGIQSQLKSLFTCTLLSLCTVAIGQLSITQVCFSNLDRYQAPDHTYPDFLEIQNTSKDTLNLNDWLISDDITDWKHRFPNNPYNLLAPGQSRRYLCDQNTHPYSIPIHLAAGETVYFRSPSAQLEFTLPSRGFNTIYIMKENRFFPEQDLGLLEKGSSSPLAANEISLELPERKAKGPLGIFGNQQKKEKVAGWISINVDQKPFRAACFISNHSPDGDKQKSIRIRIAETEDAELIAKHFQWKETTTNHFILRNGGEDGWTEKQSGIRNVLAHTLYNTINPSRKQITPELIHCNINHEFFGSYWLYPQIDEKLYKEASDVLKRTAKTPSTYQAHAGTWENYHSVESTLLAVSHEEHRLYELFQENLDTKNYFNYHFFQIFIGNQDRYSNNVKIWRSKNDHRWRYILWDLDWGFGRWGAHSPNGSSTWNALEFSLSEHAGWTKQNETKLFQHLMGHTHIRQAFIQNAFTHLNIILTPKNTTNILDSIISKVKPELHLHFEKYQLYMNQWKEECDTIRSYLLERTAAVMNHFSEWEKDSLIQIHLPNLEHGAFRLNGFDCPQSIIWPQNLPIPLTVQPHQGYKLKHWNDEALLSRWVSALEDIPLPTFIPIQETPALMISAVRAKECMSESEWIEVVNTSSEAFDVYGTRIVDGQKAFTVTTSELLQPNERIRFSELPFKLDKDGELLKLFLFDGSLTDQWDFREDCLAEDDVVTRFELNTHTLIDQEAILKLTTFGSWSKKELDPCLRNWTLLHNQSTGRRMLSSPHFGVPTVAE